MTNAPRSFIARSLAMALASALWLPAAQSQTCESPLTLEPNTTISRSTCDGQHFAGDGTGDIPELGTVLQFSLQEAQAIEFALMGHDPWFDPVLCLKQADDICSIDSCLPIEGLPAGPYRLIVSASSESAEGSCGAFTLLNQITSIDTIFFSAFE